MVELRRVFQSFQELIAVFNVSLDVGNLRVEDVTERTPPQENVTHYPHTLGVLVVAPDPSEADDGREDGLEFGQLLVDALIGGRCVFAYHAKQLLVLHDEGDDSLAIILGDVFGLVAGNSPPSRPEIKPSLTTLPSI